MLRVLWRLTRGYRFTPWRSPYLGWRMETYWGFHAEQIGFIDFWRFAWQRRADLLRYLRWAAKTGNLTNKSQVSPAAGVAQDRTRL